jgi:hypothetical protein
MGPFSVTIFWCSSIGPRSRLHFQQVGISTLLLEGDEADRPQRF